MSWVLINFLDLKGGCLFEAGGLFSFHHFRQALSKFFFLPFFLSRLNEISAGYEKIVPVSE